MFKIVLLGDNHCGKTSLAQRWTENHFEIEYIPTLGLSFYERVLELPSGDSSVTITLQIFDVNGKFCDELLDLIVGAHAILLCYDITNSASFQSILYTWLPFIEGKFLPSWPLGTVTPEEIQLRLKADVGKRKKRRRLEQITNDSSSQVNVGDSDNRSVLSDGKSIDSRSYIGSKSIMTSDAASMHSTGGDETSSVFSRRQSTVSSRFFSPGSARAANILSLYKYSSGLPREVISPYTHRGLFKPRTLPYTVLLGLKSDLSFMRSTRLEVHHEVASEKNLYTYFVSSKTGENCESALFQTAYDLAGIPYTSKTTELFSHSGMKSTVAETAAKVESKIKASNQICKMQ